MQANLPMGGNKVTGAADPTASTDLATKNYVDTQANFSTGDVKLTIKTVADSGWILCNDGSIGSATSGATYANSAAQALFLLIYNNILDAWAPVYTSSGVLSTRGAQGTAATAWAANCRLMLPLTLGRALAVSGSGSGLTTRPLGSTVGAETVALGAGNVPQISLNVSGSVSGSLGGNVPVASSGGAWNNVGNVNISGSSGNYGQSNTAIGNVNSISSSGSMSGTAGNASPTPVSTMSPEVFLNVMIKL